MSYDCRDAERTVCDQAVSFVTNNCPSKSSSMKYSGVAGPSASASCYSVSLPGFLWSSGLLLKLRNGCVQ